MRADQVDVVLAGAAAPDEPELSAFVASLRAAADVPGPRPTAALQQLLDEGLAPAVASRRTPAPVRRRPGRTLTGLGLAAKIALGAGLAAASVAGAAAFDGVPDVIQEPARAIVSGVVDLVTPGGSGQQSPAGPDEGVGVPADRVGRPDEPAGNGPPVTPTHPGISSSPHPSWGPGAGTSADPGAPAQSGTTPPGTTPPGHGSDLPGQGTGRPEVPGESADPGANSAVPPTRPTPPGQDDTRGRLDG
ncbi:hypothetical protein [Cellulomonas sp. KRMCY2]|uniref:hypothetical protein n=1 Tax=Cellulomonas sp. KRMCY2 TaxID=1304865 RepID=UPI0012DEB905|nr:hypothetical protein [Cellulomonas sp. KRMCY2]